MSKCEHFPDEGQRIVGRCGDAVRMTITVPEELSKNTQLEGVMETMKVKCSLCGAVYLEKWFDEDGVNK